ncbi:MAG TPA: DUF58 domain-containing protein [Terriglobales bacterium]|nr:DUF58 domain-containing protein [Terriglobales bacterium]
MPFSQQSEVSSEPKRLGRIFNFQIPEVWIRFLIAIVGLALAFGAALFSTVSRQSGNLWATLILSSMALILAVVVGLTTVPYLARRVAVEQFKDVFDYEVTRVGIIYMVGVVLIAIAALNTGNNLLYIIVATLLGAILISGIVSAIVLRALELDVRLPDHVFAGQAIAGKAMVRNTRDWLPSFSVSLVPIRPKVGKQWRWVPSTFAFPAQQPPQKQWFRIPDRRLRRVENEPIAPGIFEGSVYFPYLPARGQLSADLALNFERRGRYQEKSFGLATRFPFAFLTKTRHIALPREVIVYPSVEPPDEFFAVLPLISGEFESYTRGRGNDLYRIREYLPEDSARHVDWKATAKSGSLKVREFAREDERKLRIVFDNPTSGALSEKEYENAVRLAASLSWHFADQNTQLSFLSQDYKGAQQIYEFLAHLAEVQPTEPAPLLEDLPISGDYNIIVTTQPRGTIPTSLWACSYFIFLGEEKTPVG